MSEKIMQMHVILYKVLPLATISFLLFKYLSSGINDVLSHRNMPNKLGVDNFATYIYQTV